MKKYSVIYTDFGDSCDGKSRVLGTYKTLKKAQKEMTLDVEEYISNMEDNDILPREIEYEDDTSVMVGDEEYGCQWQILEVEV